MSLATLDNVNSGGLVENIEEQLMSNEEYMSAAVVLFFIGFFGFFFNLVVIVLMCKEKQLWTPLNVILFNLVCSDFSVSILGNPFTLASSIAKHWIFGPVMCIVYGFFMSLLGIASITTLTVLAFERYIMVTKPFQSQHLTRRNAVVMVLGIWAYSLILTTPPLFGWGDYGNEAANISCSVNWQEQTFNATTYILFLFALGLVVPMAIISFSYINIIKTMKQNTLRMGRVTKAEGRVTYMVAVMIVAFLIAWTPYAVLALIIQFGDPESITPAMAVVPALVAKSSICYNPLIYAGLNTQFRTLWCQMFGVRPVTDNSLAETNNRLRETNKFVSQLTQESVDDRYRNHKIANKDYKLTKTFALQEAMMLKTSKSDCYLDKSDNYAITFMDTNEMVVTKCESNKNIKKKSIEDHLTTNL